MTAANGRKRKWDLDDHGQVHIKETTINEDEKNKNISITDGANENEAKKETNIGEKSETAIDTKDAIASAKEAAMKINAILASKEPLTVAIKKNVDPVREEKNEPGLAARQPELKTEEIFENREDSITATLGLDETGAEKRTKASLHLRKFKCTVDVNDSRHRYYLTKSETICEIEREIPNVTLLVKGKYYPDRSLVTEKDPPPLCIELSADEEETLEKAAKKIKDIMLSGPPSLRPPPQLLLKVFAPFDSEFNPPGFNFRQKILGPQGSFLRHIQSESGAKVNLRGRGSGYIDIGAPKDEPMESLHILLIANKQTELDYAKQLCEDLLDTVRIELESLKQTAAAAAIPMPNYYQMPMMNNPNMNMHAMPHMYYPVQHYQSPMGGMMPPPLPSYPYQLNAGDMNQINSNNGDIINSNATAESQFVTNTTTGLEERREGESRE